jgi:hypothetical protein
MKVHYFLTFIILINLAKYSTSLILKKEKSQKDVVLDNTPEERKLVVMDHYEDRRKDYEAAKCKSSFIIYSIFKKFNMRLDIKGYPMRLDKF